MPSRTTCLKGLHDLTDPANVRTKPNGDRQCKPCHAAAKKAWAKRMREANPPKLQPILRDDCCVEGCGRPRHRSGEWSRSRYCSAHLHRQIKYGEAFEDVPVGDGRWNRPMPEQRAALRQRP